MEFNLDLDVSGNGFPSNNGFTNNLDISQSEMTTTPNRRGKRNVSQMNESRNDMTANDFPTNNDVSM
jgi:hypothetical protein